VPQTRREFLTHAAAATAAIGITGCAPAAAPAPPAPASPAPATGGGDPTFKDLAMLALDAAKSAGASYADVRISRNRNQALFTRERRVQNLVDNETFGFGVRVLVDGAWGFAASRELTRDEVSRIARQAVDQARANRTTLVRPVTLAPVTPTASGTWRSPARIDPVDVPIEE
jgi:TldD protein